MYLQGCFHLNTAELGCMDGKQHSPPFRKWHVISKYHLENTLRNLRLCTGTMYFWKAILSKHERKKHFLITSCVYWISKLKFDSRKIQGIKGHIRFFEKDRVKILAKKISVEGGVILIIDYGHTQTAIGETLQAVKNHIRFGMIE